MALTAESLRAMQAPLKDKYKADPGSAVITMRANASVADADDKVACKLSVGKQLQAAGLHPMAGGTGAELCSGDMLLEALVACAGVTLKAVSTAIEVPLKSGTVKAEGDLDFRGTLGIDKEAPVGFKEIRLIFELDSEAPQEKLEKLVKLTERYCVVLQTLTGGATLSSQLVRPEPQA